MVFLFCWLRRRRDKEEDEEGDETYMDADVDISAVSVPTATPDGSATAGQPGQRKFSEPIFGLTPGIVAAGSSREPSQGTAGVALHILEEIELAGMDGAEMSFEEDPMEQVVRDIVAEKQGARHSESREMATELSLTIEADPGMLD